MGRRYLGYVLCRTLDRIAEFETHFGIHTFFVKKPIDVLVLDKDFIVRKFANVKPNRIFFWSPKYIRVIEVQSGFIQKHKIKPGDKITIK